MNWSKNVARNFFLEGCADRAMLVAARSSKGFGFLLPTGNRKRAGEKGFYLYRLFPATRNFSGDAIDLNLPYQVSCNCYAHRGHRFVNIAPSYVELTQLCIGLRQMC